MRRIRIMEHISLDGVIQHSADDGDFPTATGPGPWAGRREPTSESIGKKGGLK